MKIPGFTVPLSVAIGALSVIYPVVMVAVMSFLAKHSQKRLPATVVGLLGLLWPATIAGAIGLAPIWALCWVASNYMGAVKGFLSRRGRAFESPEVVLQNSKFNIGQNVTVHSSCRSREGATVAPGYMGKVTAQQGVYVRVDFDAQGGGGVHWIHESNLS